MLRLTALTLLALAAGALAAPPPSHSAAAPAARSAKPPVLSAKAKRGLAFAKARCAACHGLTADAGSPNPEAPPFEAVANQPGLTRTTLRRFLRDSHNFPAAMNFTVAPSDIDDLAAYMVTLKTPGYRPAI